MSSGDWRSTSDTESRSSCPSTRICRLRARTSKEAGPWRTTASHCWPMWSTTSSSGSTCSRSGTSTSSGWCICAWTSGLISTRCGSRTCSRRFSPRCTTSRCDRYTANGAIGSMPGSFPATITRIRSRTTSVRTAPFSSAGLRSTCAPWYPSRSLEASALCGGWKHFTCLWTSSATFRSALRSFSVCGQPCSNRCSTKKCRSRCEIGG
mmetsp:Transcript_55413/g.142735  ORF Transcript_55413/g.142735 Transcript_55413/m.142735 type:complete len:208 (+) Transcript_55413:453-1076(+)